MKVFETYRGVDIVDTGTTFRIEQDVAEVVEYDGSNGDLEEDLAAIAEDARIKIKWGSEGDTLVANCGDIGTCRWLIDRAYEVAGKDEDEDAW